MIRILTSYVPNIYNLSLTNFNIKIYPKKYDLKMLFGSHRRNLLLRCSIVINIAVLLYAAMHLTGTTQNPATIEWVQVPYDGPNRALNSVMENEKRSDQLKTTDESMKVNTNNITSETNVKFIDEVTVKNPTSSRPDLKLVSKSNFVTEEQKAEVESTESDDLDQQDENGLSDATLNRLKALMDCRDKVFDQSTRQRGEFWSLVNYVRADHGLIPCHETVTYTTHAGFEFLDNVLPLVERWMAPVSLAVHAPGSDLDSTVESIRYLRDCTGSELIRNYVTFHVFFSHKHIPSSIPSPDAFLAKPYNCSQRPPFLANVTNTYMKQKNLLYPVNVARNLAREAALSHYILPSDIELYPSPNMVPRFLNMIARNEKPLNTSTKPRVFPISIFEVAANVWVPSSKTELQQMLNNKTAIPFHKHVCPNCHNIPQGPQWMKAAETELMGVFHVGKREGKFLHWEPIFIGTNSEPYYDERLSWEGKQDKMTQGYILCVMDYEFMILNNAFLTHKPGIKQYKKNAKRDSIAARQNKLISHIIYPELKKLFGVKQGCAV